MKYVHIIISITYLFVFFILFSLVFSSVELVHTCILKNILTYKKCLNEAFTEIPSILTILKSQKNINNIDSDLKLQIACVNRAVNKYYNNDIIRDIIINILI